MNKRSSNAVPLSSFYGLSVGDKLRPGADMSMVGKTISDHEIEMDDHPSLEGMPKPVIFTFHELIVHAKNWIARQDGYSEDPVKARTAYKHGLCVDKDPRKRRIIAYSRAMEYQDSEEGKAERAQKIAKLEESKQAKEAREAKKRDRLIAKQNKIQEEIDSLEAKLNAKKAAAAASPATVIEDAQEEVATAILESKDSKAPKKAPKKK